MLERHRQKELQSQIYEKGLAWKYADTPITPKPIEYDKDENPEGKSLRGSLIYTTKIFVDNDIFKGMNKKILEPTFKETQKMPVLIEIRG